MLKADLQDIIGHPSPSDKTELIKRMRFHQGWFRAFVLNIESGAHPKIKTKTICSSIDNGKDNCFNFIDSYALKAVEETFKARNEGAKGMIDEYRLFNNLLSSQPLCFNFFGRLKYNKQLATTIISKFFPSVKEVKVILFEFAPNASSNGDNSAHDIAIEFIDESGRFGLIGIECKYTEDFSQKEYDKPSYKKAYADSKAFTVPYENLIKKEYNQLFRNQLIVETALLSKKYEIVYGALFCYEKDSNALTKGEAFQTMIVNGDERFKVITFKQFIEAVQQLDVDWETREWSMMLWARYTALTLSNNINI